MMDIATIQASSLDIPFRTAFEHSSAKREATSAVLVTVTTADGISGFGEGCPRPYVTNETVDDAIGFINRISADVADKVHDLATLLNWLGKNDALVDKSPAAWCAVELALLDALGKSVGKSVEALLGLPKLEGAFQYSAVIGVSNEQVFDMMLGQYLKAGFSDFKLKLSGDVQTDRAHIQAVYEKVPAARVRVDANNLWAKADEAIAFFNELDEKLFAIEEPLAANDYDGMLKLYHATGLPLILDESCLCAEQVVTLPGAAHSWIINLRVSKMGGLLRALDVLQAVRDKGCKLIIGAQVGETSILTRAALAIANAARDQLEAQEGAFGSWLLEHDVCDPPLMFAAGGVLEKPISELANKEGLGLEIKI